VNLIKAVIFDFGGVVAEEGFREGLKAIGRKNGLDPQNFFKAAGELVYKTGYVVGRAPEADYWNAVRERTGITGTDGELREEILKRFTLRDKMIEYIKGLKSTGLTTAVLSDQTNWLEEIDRSTPFFLHFDHVFNSFRLRKGKRDPSVFTDVCSLMGLEPDEALFVDDNIENVRSAALQGLKALHFIDMESLKRELETFIN
jgi:putative hydrolase of the HAD superfamily